MRNPNCRCSARGRTRTNFLTTSITWCTCGLSEDNTRENPAEETYETVKTKEPNIATKNGTTEMEETPKSGNTIVTEEAKKPTAVIRKKTKTLMETKLGLRAAGISKGIMDTEI